MLGHGGQAAAAESISTLHGPLSKNEKKPLNIPFHPATQIRVGLDAPAVSYAAREKGGGGGGGGGGAPQSEGETGGQREERGRKAG